MSTRDKVYCDTTRDYQRYLILVICKECINTSIQLRKNVMSSHCSFNSVVKRLLNLVMIVKKCELKYKMEFAIIILATLTVVVECGHYTSAYGNYQPAYSTNTWANWNYPPITGYSWPYTYSTNYGNNNNNNCRPTITTVSGRFAPSGQLCSGQLILNEEFNNFAKDFWQHEITLGGGGVS